MISLICGVYNTAQVNISMKQKHIHRRRERTCDCQRGLGVGEERIENLRLADAN